MFYCVRCRLSQSAPSWDVWVKVWWIMICLRFGENRLQLWMAMVNAWLPKQRLNNKYPWYVPHKQHNHVCNFQVRFPLLWVRVNVEKPKSEKSSQLETHNRSCGILKSSWWACPRLTPYRQKFGVKQTKLYWKNIGTIETFGKKKFQMRYHMMGFNHS